MMKRLAVAAVTAALISPASAQHAVPSASGAQFLELDINARFSSPYGVEATYWRLVNNEGQTMTSLDADGTITFHNAGALSLPGNAPEPAASGTIDFAGFYTGPGFPGGQVGWILVYVNGKPVLIPAYGIAIPAQHSGAGK